MTKPEIDMLCVGACAGVPVGAWLGYQLRKAIDGFSLRRERKRWEQQNSPTNWTNLPRARAVAVAKAVEPMPLPPVNAARAYRSVGADEIVIGSRPYVHEAINPDRNDVITALVSAGYSKKTATAAADACTTGELASVETWTAAALRHASGAP